MSNQFEREAEFLERQLEECSISNSEYNREIRELEREYNDAAEEAAQEAYDNEMRNW